MVGKIITLYLLLGLLASTTGTSESHTQSQPQRARKRVCYLLSGERYLDYLISPGRLKLSLCTHFIHSFASVSNGLIQIEPSMSSYIQQINHLRNTTSNTTLFLVSIGGDDFSFVRNNRTATDRFIDSLITLIADYQLDGIDIDWEFPYLSNDKATFTFLIQSIRTRFNLESHRQHRVQPLLVSVALSPIIYIAYKSYEIKKLSSLVDFVNLMTYDYHTPNTVPLTNHNAPLYANRLDRFYFKYFNVAFSANYIYRLGMPKEKIMVGIPFYGYLYYLAREERHDLYALSNGTQETVLYNQICRLASIPPTIRVFDRRSKVPYMYREKAWISYDDVESVAMKAQWIVDEDFGGSMSFALNYDDFRGECGFGLTFPLQSTLYDTLSS